MSVDADIAAAVKSVMASGIPGGPAFPVVTTSPDLPWCVFRIPFLDVCSSYVRASREDPLMGAMGMARMTIVALPQGVDLEALIASKPFVVMRAVQVLLAELGLSTRAEKKSLN